MWFNAPTFSVDTHIARITLRMGFTSRRDYEEIRGFWTSNTLIDLYLPFHLLLIMLGRETCRAREPLCSVCIVRDYCRYCRGSWGLTRGDLSKRIARKVLEEDYASRLWKRVEFIGDIALIRTPLGMDPRDLKPLAEELIKRLSYVKSVWVAIPGVFGEYRLRRHVWLAGEE